MHQNADTSNFSSALAAKLERLLVGIRKALATPGVDVNRIKRQLEELLQEEG